MDGRLSKIYVNREKGSPTESVSQARLDKYDGLVGDYRSKSSDKDRQLAILLDSDRQNIDENYNDRGLCTRRFLENILIEGFSSNQLAAHTILEIGESKIEITSIGKRCFEECKLVKNKEYCPLKEGTLFGKVIESGTIKVGDIVTKENRKRIGE